MPDLSSLIKAYDVRGVVPDQWDEEISRAIGAAFAEFVVADSGATAVVTAHDMRESSIPLSRAFAEGVISRGVDVVEAGLGSTDLLYFAAGSLDMPGAMFTASHNPAQYNGIKMCRAGAAPIGQDSGLVTIREWAERDGYDRDPGRVGEVTQRDVLAEYAAHLHGLVDLSGIRQLKVVVDAGNGMGGHTVPVVLSGLPLEIVPAVLRARRLLPEPRGQPAGPGQPGRPAGGRPSSTAPTSGWPSTATPTACSSSTSGASRSAPRPITALVAVRELAKGHGTTIIHNLITSRAVPEIVREHGGNPVRTRVGHSFIKAEMARTDAVFGGEHSAHYYFRDFWRADTGMLAAMHVLAALGEQARPLSELTAAYSRYEASGEINSTVADAPARMAEVRESFREQDGAAVDDMDGLTVELSDGSWFNLRASNTEPLLRLNVEAPDAARMAELRDQVLGMVRA